MFRLYVRMYFRTLLMPLSVLLLATFIDLTGNVSFEGIITSDNGMMLKGQDFEKANLVEKVPQTLHSNEFMFLYLPS